MPLHTEILRDGERLPLRWGDFHIAAMALASCFDASPGAGYTGSLRRPDSVYEVPDKRMFDCYPDAPFPVTRYLAFMLADYGSLSKTPLNDGAYTLRRRHAFIDVTDGEVLRLQPGDELHAVRGW